MKTLLIAINSQYVHLNLAVRSLNASLNHKAEMMEFNINNEIGKVFADIVLKKPDLILFSTYIWNIDFVLNLASDLKKAMPKTKIVLGGPEVSFESKKIIAENDFIDYILCGECEEILPRFIQAVENGDNITDLTGVVGREYADDTYNIVQDINVLKPISEIYNVIEPNKIYYYETARGCPFSCSYCLSGSIKDTTRYLDLERVFVDLKYFSDNNIPLVKFVDRTFNANKKRAKEIIRFCIENTGDTSFHFEVGADILDDEIIDLLNNAPHGKFQLEAGVQSCNEKTLEAVIRTTNLEKLAKNTTKIIEANNVHMHLDLIAGLPYEDFHSFGRSFSELFKLSPHHLQLGFLKLLKGSRLLAQAEEYGIVYRDYPPYEVISTNDITASELILLKDIEEVVERYYNADIGRNSLEILRNECPTPFVMFKIIAEDFRQKGYLSYPMNISTKLQVLGEYIKDEFELDTVIWHKILREMLNDILKNGAKGNLPSILDDIIIETDNKPYKNKLLELKKITGDEYRKAKFFAVKNGDTQEIIMAISGKITVFKECELCQ
ncbi:MAG: DUF4080 domain-containing protein [Clostridia bacterium]